MTLPPPPDPVLAYAPPPRRGSRLPWVLGGAAVLAAVLCLGGAGVLTVWLLDATETSRPVVAEAPALPPSAEPGPAGADAAAWPELTALPATAEPTLRSGGNGTPTRVAFVNDSAQVVTVSWLDQDGSRVTYQTLRPGAAYTQPTYVGHPWVVAAADGRALAVFQPAPEPGRAVVR